MQTVRKLLPSLITFSRIPVAVFFYGALEAGAFSLLPLLFFCLVYIELSDLLDGYLARRLNSTSNFGKIFDPAADVTCHFLCIFALDNRGVLPKVVLLIFVLREYWVLLIRAQLMRVGVVLSAKLGGKIKTFLYAAALFLVLIFFPSGPFSSTLLGIRPYINGLWYIASAVSLGSGMHYAFIAYRALKAHHAQSKAHHDQGSPSSQS